MRHSENPQRAAVSMKRFIKFLGYLVVIVMGITATVVLGHMWRVEEYGRHRVAVRDNRLDSKPVGESSPSVPKDSGQ
jgi:hypothetical protein